MVHPPPQNVLIISLWEKWHVELLFCRVVFKYEIADLYSAIVPSGHLLLLSAVCTVRRCCWSRELAVRMTVEKVPCGGVGQSARWCLVTTGCMLVGWGGFYTVSLNWYLQIRGVISPVLCTSSFMRLFTLQQIFCTSLPLENLKRGDRANRAGAVV